VFGNGVFLFNFHGFLLAAFRVWHFHSVTHKQVTFLFLFGSRGTGFNSAILSACCVGGPVGLLALLTVPGKYLTIQLRRPPWKNHFQT
jgi:hypothetical protein